MSTKLEARRRRSAASETGKQRARRRRRTATIRTAALGVVVVAALFGIFVANQGGEAIEEAGLAGSDSRYPYVVGDPGAGEQAPGFSLPSTTGGEVTLNDFRGQTVLLYFQEGLMCQPCWEQIKEIEEQWDDFAALDIDAVVSITTDPVGALTQKSELEGLRSPVLSDPDLAVSRRYDTNAYGMMGGSHNGHSFILIGPEGEILWRADYGGEPKYTMYLPTDVLLTDLRQGVGNA